MAQEKKLPNPPMRRIKRPRLVLFVASLTIFSGLYGLSLSALSPVNLEQANHLNQATWESTIQRTWIVGIGISEIIIGTFTFKGREWAWNSNVLSQIISLAYLSLFISMMPNSEKYANEQFLIEIIIPMIVSILILPCMFKLQLRTYFGKGNFYFKDIVRLNDRVARNYLHHFWIASICVSILFSIMGLLVLIVSGLNNREILWIASLLFITSAIIPGLAFEACKKKSRLSGLLLLIVFTVTAGLAATSSAIIYGHIGFWSFSTEILGIPLLQGVRCVSHLSRAASL